MWYNYKIFIKLKKEVGFMEKVVINKFALEQLENERNKLNEMYVNRTAYTDVEIQKQSCVVDKLMNQHKCGILT